MRRAMKTASDKHVSFVEKRRRVESVACHEGAPVAEKQSLRNVSAIQLS